MKILKRRGVNKRSPKVANLECTVLVSSQEALKIVKYFLSMTKLHYVGFNGYHQCPKNENGLPKVITNWICFKENGIINTCAHRFVVLDTEEFFQIYGMLNATSKKRLHQLRKPSSTSNCGSCDEFLIVSEGKDIWKYYYENSKWEKCEVKVSNNEKSIWEEKGSKILKFSFQQNFNDVLILLSNGSAWVLSSEGELKLIFPYDLDKVIDISSGLEHSLFLTESGCVLALGCGSRGQLGLGDLNPTAQPVQVAALEGLKVSKIATGGWHSCAITDSGDLYMWGWNNYGQLSAFEDGKKVGLTALPVFVEIGEESDIKAIDVACGRRHTVVLLENHDLYSTGWNTYSQLGIDSPCEKVSKFTKCQIEKVQNRKVICGPWYTILVDKS